MASEKDKQRFMDHVTGMGHKVLKEVVFSIPGGDLMVVVEHPFVEGWTHAVTGRVDSEQGVVLNDVRL